MKRSIGVLWAAPEVNPINFKARSIPVLNPINQYGRVFFFSWWGFMIAFWSWYAFPPLLTITIKNDLALSQTDISNSNIVALVATLLVRLVAGSLCDRFGPRWTFAGCLLAGAIPTALAGTVYSIRGLLALRFFVGILGGSFVPCQVWTTGFFDKNVVGTANALTAGWGNAGGGITYFVMPAIFDSLVSQQNLSPHQAWRVAFVVPFILISLTAVLLLLLCPDTPTGKWSDRHIAPQGSLSGHHVDAQIVDIPGSITEPHKPDANSKSLNGSEEKFKVGDVADAEAQLSEKELIETAQGEVIQKPTLKEGMHVFFSPQTLALAGCYFCSFGAELALNSILAQYYLKNFPGLGQTGTGSWAAMFGLLNVVFRPLGGVASDVIYRRTRSVWGKKIWIHSLAVVTGGFLLAIGLLDSHDQSTMFGLVAGMAFFLEAGNGANFSLVPHVHPYANGIVSGVTGAAGNFGGVIFAIIFRFSGTHYGRAFWIIGVMTIAINVALSWIRPIPKGQIGGR
ncbi:MAG: hypothetical protein M4579_001416 [Chaenotheca gracillima]|nr:MAG: hypothetical protein M4579_001416 [Chaenotheca gracillima]